MREEKREFVRFRRGGSWSSALGTGGVAWRVVVDLVGADFHVSLPPGPRGLALTLCYFIWRAYRNAIGRWNDRK